MVLLICKVCQRRQMVGTRIDPGCITLGAAEAVGWQQGVETDWYCPFDARDRKPQVTARDKKDAR